MSRRRSKRGLALILAVILFALAGGLLVVLGLTVKQLVQLDRLEADRTVLRQMIDSGAAWARRHAGDWPATGEGGDRVQLDAAGVVRRPCVGSVTIEPAPAAGPTIERVRVEARLTRSSGRVATRTAAVRIKTP